MFSCKTKTDNPEHILKSKEISMNIEHYGCLGGGTQTIEIREENGIRMLTSSFENGLDIPEKKLEFNAEKELVLAELISASKSLPEDTYCTGLSIYNITTEKYKYKFEDRTCTLQDELAELIK